MTPRTRHLFIVCACSVLALGPAFVVASTPTDDVRMLAAESDAWSRWRGPSGQGHVEGSDFPDRWSATEGILWRAKVPGSGNSSPVVWGQRIFLTTAEDGGARRSVLAYDRTTGRQLWQTYAPDADPEGAYPKNGHASSTPTTDGERVYAYLGNHGLLATDLDGKVSWHVALGPFEAFHGTASSPLLLGDRLFLVQDQRGGSGSFIAAFDTATGKELWRTARDAKVGWNSPVAVEVTADGKTTTQIVMSGQQKVIAYSPRDGRELWTVEGNTFETIPTPVVAHGMIFCSSGRAGPTLAIRPSHDSAEIVWSSPKGSPFVPAPIVVGDYLYMVNDMASILTVYEAKTGEVVQQERMGEAQREGFSAAPVAVDGKVFFTNDEGQTFVVRHGETPEILHVNELGERVIASPAGVDGTWYFRTASSLLAIGSR